MITITDTCRFSAPSFLSQYLNLEETVIFDIETTGFSPKTSSIYLIGVLIPGYKKWHLTQWLASSPEDETAVLTAFWNFFQIPVVWYILTEMPLTCLFLKKDAAFTVSPPSGSPWKA